MMTGVVVVAACGATPTPSQVWSGTSTSDGEERTLTLEVRRSGDQIDGEYEVGIATGTLDGTVIGETVTATLSPAAGCTYAFEGTMADGVIEGTYQPEGCPGGTPGEWYVELQ